MNIKNHHTIILLSFCFTLFFGNFAGSNPNQCPFIFSKLHDFSLYKKSVQWGREYPSPKSNQSIPPGSYLIDHVENVLHRFFKKLSPKSLKELQVNDFFTLLIASHLHDNLLSTQNMSYDKIKAEFSPDIAQMVFGISEPKIKSESLKNKIEVQRLRASHPLSFSLKLAHHISEIENLNTNTPIQSQNYPQGLHSSYLNDFQRWNTTIKINEDTSIGELEALLFNHLKSLLFTTP